MSDNVSLTKCCGNVHIYTNENGEFKSKDFLKPDWPILNYSEIWCKMVSTVPICKSKQENQENWISSVVKHWDPNEGFFELQ